MQRQRQQPSKRGARRSKASTPSRSARQGARAGIDVEMNAGAVAIGALRRTICETDNACRTAVKLPSPRTDAGQRAHVAAEGDIVQLERPAAGGVMQRDAAGQVQPVDRQRSQIEFSGRGRPVDPALLDRARDRAPCR